MTTDRFQTYAEYLADCYKAGSFMMRSKPEPEELEMLVVPFTYLPNVAELIDTSNWECFQRELAEVDPNGADHDIIGFGHWATPYDLLRVKPGSEACRVARKLIARLAQYPVLDEGDLSERELESAATDLTDALNGLTIVVNGKETDNGQTDALWQALWERLTECETPECIDRRDVERELSEMGFTYDADEFTWSGKLTIKA